MRNKLGSNVPKPPDNINFVYDIEYTTLNTGESMIFGDFIEGNGRVTMFSSEYLFKNLCNATLWLSDGTFQNTPNLFYQIFVMHGNVVGDNYITYPMAFFLMTGKSAILYDKVMDMIQSAAEERGYVIFLERHLSDFEMAIRNAIEKSFPSKYQFISVFGAHENIRRYFKINKSNESVHTEISFVQIE